MKKEKRIAKYGEAAYEKDREHARVWREANPVKVAELKRQWEKANPEKVKAHSRDQCRKGGSRYGAHLKYQIMGVPGAKHRIRQCHRDKWRPFKKIIAPNSQIHHEWILGTSRYRGVALVETNAHRHGNIDVIRILDGEITVLTEAELKAK